MPTYILIPFFYIFTFRRFNVKVRLLELAPFILGNPPQERRDMARVV